MEKGHTTTTGVQNYSTIIIEAGYSTGADHEIITIEFWVPSWKMCVLETDLPKAIPS
jgi:hypothetical protein